MPTGGASAHDRRADHEGHRTTSETRRGSGQLAALRRGREPTTSQGPPCLTAQISLGNTVPSGVSQKSRPRDADTLDRRAFLSGGGIPAAVSARRAAWRRALVPDAEEPTPLPIFPPRRGT